MKTFLIIAGAIFAGAVIIIVYSAIIVGKRSDEE